MTLAAGLFKTVAYKVESAFGTAPTQASAQQLRRVTSSLDLNKDTYKSNEIRPDMQIADFRHGVRRVKGAINGELSAGTYKDFMAAALKKAWTATTAMTGLTLSVGIGGAPLNTITRSAGSWLTDGVKVGDVVQITAGSVNALNLNKNCLVTDIASATVLTVITLNGTAMATDTSVVSCTLTVMGKKSYVPATGHTDLSYAIEHWYSDITQSELFLGCKVDKIALNLPPTGMATISCDFTGQDFADVTTKRGAVALNSQYFTSPTTITTTGNLAAVNGVLRLNATTMATVTGMSLSIDPGFTGDPVVGANTVPNLFPGTVNVTGQVTAYFDTAALRDAFVAETETSLYVALTADNTASSAFIAISLPRIKLGGSAKTDGEGGIVQTFPFQCLYNSNGGTGILTEKTTISIQDSAA